MLLDADPAPPCSALGARPAQSGPSPGPDALVDGRLRHGACATDEVLEILQDAELPGDIGLFAPPTRR
ncbi:MAG: hypothetical protein IPI35_21185 [Deltaproteobacteria bacterium]|nr:hypothetical protein [Deltaproteobacteria bacterium]